MVDSDLPHECPICGKDAPRAFLTAPYLATMSGERRLAHATNERSASVPRALSKSSEAHGSGCGCCSGKPLYATARRRTGKNGTDAKSFPTRRPWMLSH
jgi:hypothetical protein